jgi:hypothetical protein
MDIKDELVLTLNNLSSNDFSIKIKNNIENTETDISNIESFQIEPLNKGKHIRFERIGNNKSEVGFKINNENVFKDNETHDYNDFLNKESYIVVKIANNNYNFMKVTNSNDINVFLDNSMIGYRIYQELFDNTLTSLMENLKYGLSIGYNKLQRDTYGKNYFKDVYRKENSLIFNSDAKLNELVTLTSSLQTLDNSNNQFNLSYNKLKNKFILKTNIYNNEQFHQDNNN